MTPVMSSIQVLGKGGKTRTLMTLHARRTCRPMYSDRRAAFTRVERFLSSELSASMIEIKPERNRRVNNRQ